MTQPPDTPPPSALVPELERALVAAARRGGRPAIAARARGSSTARGSSKTRAWLRSPLLAAALVVAAFGAGALAATGVLLSGAPLSLPRGAPLQPRSGLGVPVRDSSAAIALQVRDPAGGPRWGARFIATTRGYGCLQFGRVVDGELGVIGQDGVFSDDGRFHALPLDYLEGPFPCAPLDARGHAFAGVFMDGTPASGQVVEQSCSAPGRRITPPTPVCAAKDERLVMAGMAGPLARAVTYAEPGGRTRTVATVGPQGAYLIVTRAPARLGLEGGEYEPGGPGTGMIRRITYSDGRVCRPGEEDGLTARSCPHVGEQPLNGPRVTAAAVRSRVAVALGERRVQLRYRSQVAPMFIISFRARVAVDNGASEYLVSVTCGDTTQLGPVSSDVRRGQIVTQEMAQNHCSGRARVTVQYAYGGQTDGQPLYINGTHLLVGTRTVEVR